MYVTFKVLITEYALFEWLIVTPGSATRSCDAEGEWSEPDILSCQSVEFNNILNQVTRLLYSVFVFSVVQQWYRFTLQLLLN